MDYLTKPFDPWVLRAKVSVLVELWERNARLREQADQAQSYRHRLTTAATLVQQARSLVEGGQPADLAELRTVLAEAADQLVTE